MSDYDPQSHPLHGLGLQAMLSELVLHYDWPILFEQIPLNCFNNKPDLKSCVKFIHKTQWARERVEAFYLYKFKQCPLPSDEQHQFSPRNRAVDGSLAADCPAEIELGGKEFFDDPASGPKLPSKTQVQKTRDAKKTDDKVKKENVYKAKSSIKDADAEQIKGQEAGIALDQSDEADVAKAQSDKTTEKAKSVSAKSTDPWGKWKKD